MTNNKKYLLIIFLVLLIITLFICTLLFSARIVLSKELNHLSIARQIHNSNISDDDLIKIFDNNINVSKMDKNITIFLAAYLNALENKMTDNDFFLIIKKSDGLNVYEKIFLINTIKYKYIPMI